MSELKDGWYWVRIANRWEPCEWSSGIWISPDYICGLDNEDLGEELGPRIPSPDETTNET